MSSQISTTRYPCPYGCPRTFGNQKNARAHFFCDGSTLDRESFPYFFEMDEAIELVDLFKRDLIQLPSSSKPDAISKLIEHMSEMVADPKLTKSYFFNECVLLLPELQTKPELFAEALEKIQSCFPPMPSSLWSLVTTMLDTCIRQVPDTNTEMLARLSATAAKVANLRQLRFCFVAPASE